MKKILVTAAALCLFCMTAIACADKELPAGSVPTTKNEIVLSGFEDYYDLQKIQWSGIIGSVSLNEDKTYVRKGEKSAKFVMDYDDDIPTDYNDNDGGKTFSECTKPQIIFGTYLYDQAVSNTEKIDAFRISVYNANDRAVDLLFAVRDDGKKVAFTDGRRLEPGRWNDVSFDFKPYFHDGGIGVTEYVLYVYDDASDTADKITLYFDDCHVRTTANKTAPEKTYDDGEILSFGDMRDTAYCLTTTASGTYPAFYATYTDREIFAGQRGCLMTTMRPGLNWQYDVNVSNNGYKLHILDSVATARAAGATAVSVDCMNDGAGDLYVRLVVKSAAKTATVAELLSAKGGKTVTCDLSVLEGESPTSMYVQIDNWNLVGTYNVYFRNLKAAA